MSVIMSDVKTAVVPSQSSPYPIVLSYGAIEFYFHVPTAIHNVANDLKQTFLKNLATLPEHTDPDEIPSTPAELVARYMGFIAGHLEKPSPHEALSKVLLTVVEEFEKALLAHNDVHVLVQTLSISPNKKNQIIRFYYLACDALERPTPSKGSNIFSDVAEDRIRTYCIFGGQGNIEEYFKELRELYTIYRPFLTSFISRCADHLSQLTRHESAQRMYSKGFNVLQWLDDSDSQPDIDYLVSAPVSLPLIGLLQFCHYVVTCRIVGCTPGQLLTHFKGMTGHSQGIITAVAVAMSFDWHVFESISLDALTIFFWIGIRTQQVYPHVPINPMHLKDSLKHGEGSPSPMLLIKDLSLNEIQKHIDITNYHLPPDRHIAIALVNSPRNTVVAGHPISICGLNHRIRKIKVQSGEDQSRIPFNQRKPGFINCFLPVSVPFHTSLLKNATPLILQDLGNITTFTRTNLKKPVFDTYAGLDLRNGECDQSLLPELVRMVVETPVFWQKSTNFSTPTHIVDFGPGGTSGIGILTQRNKVGTGVRVILAGALYGSNTEVGYKAELFDSSDHNPVKFSKHWVTAYGPKLVKNFAGHVVIDTKLTRLTGLPPIVVAGMTPTTVAWDFVAATMNAGYEIELAGGGYVSEQKMSDALIKLENNIPPGRGICINLIYLNPAAIQWQIPMVRRLCADGFPILGLTIGAGVPSLEVASEYIKTLGIKRIAFKPGSIEGIQQVIRIAKAHPAFPVILQWTGGRGGGHHSFEDFHQPMTTMYAKIRQCENIILVAGSGFGNGEDSYQYLNGSWSAEHELPWMPFDGILFGSRMMVAKESHTSAQAKAAICVAEGVEDSDWDQTYKHAAGGVITVLSEMGQPIHKIATRAVLFWSEMDKKIFSLSPAKRLPALLEMKSYIIQKLNDDYQKVWFGRNRLGKSVDVEEMTYVEILMRLIELLYVEHERRWIDQSYIRLVRDFVFRIEERFTEPPGSFSIAHGQSDWVETPSLIIQRILESCPGSDNQLISAQDVEFFFTLCCRRNQKPVPFVPVLDENFEFYFKKDSLWQSEDLAAVVGQDVGRVCILQGPVAVKYNTVPNEPVKDILDKINRYLVDKLVFERYNNDESGIPRVGHIGGESVDNQRGACKGFSELKWVRVEEKDGKTIYHVLNAPPAAEPPMTSTDWLKILAGRHKNARKAFFLSESFVQGHKHQVNPCELLFVPEKGVKVEVSSLNSADDQHQDKTNSNLMIEVFHPTDEKGMMSRAIQVLIEDDRKITLNMYAIGVGESEICLPLYFEYHPECGYAPIHEVMSARIDRIKQFYFQIWYGEKLIEKDWQLINMKFFEPAKTILGSDIREFVCAVQNTEEYFVDEPGKIVYAPIDFAIVAGWKAIIKPLFDQSIDADLLKLVHLQNGFTLVCGAKPLKKNDVVQTNSEVVSVLNESIGKIVKVRGSIMREGKLVMQVSSHFLFRGTYNDFENTFEKREERPFELHLQDLKDVAVLKSKKWFNLEKADEKLEDKRLVFMLESINRFQSEKVFKSVKTTGKVYKKHISTDKKVQIGYVDYSCEGLSYGNPVIDYLIRKGKPTDEPVLFKNEISLHGKQPLKLRVPTSNMTYARASGDYNPIHVNKAFSNYAGLPGTITHGMHTSARVRALVEMWVAKNRIGGMKSYNVKFTGMVLPDTQLNVELVHVGMVAGCKIIDIEVTTYDTNELVLKGTAEVEQPVSAYLFTGQGSQKQGMGMDLYETSSYARDVWDRADKHFRNNYGFSIIEIVRNDPKELTVHFGGKLGNKIRKNYIDMTFESVNVDGKMTSERIFKTITEKSSSYTYRSCQGLLSATQFTQPALTLMEKASFEDMRSRGLIPRGCAFAGHSLGEYSALAALAEVMPIESLVSIVFYRGLTMQVAVKRDNRGQSNFLMCAVNPTKIGRAFDERALENLVKQISERSEWLVEIVNYNIAEMQYVAAGDLRALDVLTNVANQLKEQSDRNADQLVEKDQAWISRKIDIQIERTRAMPPNTIKLKRGHATVPLEGIDVPFHSKFLRSGVNPFRTFLLKNIERSLIDCDKLMDKYIPNLTAKPFQLSRDYFEQVYELTQSPRLGKVLHNWDRFLEEERKGDDDSAAGSSADFGPDDAVYDAIDSTADDAAHDGEARARTGGESSERSNLRTQVPE